MAFDTNVAPPSPAALDLKPPQSIGPLETLAQLQQLRAGKQQMQTQELQQQGLQMENQQRQMDLQDQQTVRAMLPKLLSDPNNQGSDGAPDWNKITQAVSPSVQPKTAFGIQQMGLGNAEKAATIRKTNADAAEAQQKLDAAERDYLGQTFLGIRQADYSPAVAEAALLQAETLHPQYKQHVEQLRNLIAQNPANLKNIIDMGIQQSTAAATQAREQTTADLTNQKTTLENAATKRTQAIQELSGIMDAQGNVQDPQALAQWQRKYKDIAPAATSPQALLQFQRSGVPVKEQPTFDLDTAKAKALIAIQKQDPAALDAQIDAIVPTSDPMNASTKVLAHAAAMRPDALTAVPKILQDAYDQRGRVQVAKENAQNKISIDLGNVSGTPGQPSSLAKAVANYQQSLGAAVGRGGPAARERIMEQVLAVNPDFHEEYYNTFNSTEKDAVTGKIGTSANALNTMMGHLSVLRDAATDLDNSDFQALNRIANWIGVQTGSDAKTTYDTIVHRLGPEVTKAYLASGGSVGERGTNEEDFGSNLGPKQILSNIGVSALLADSKIKALQDQYQRGTYGKGQQKLISDEAEAARQKLSGLAPRSVQGNGGKSYQKTAIGPNGHQIGWNPGDTAWTDLSTGKPVK